MKEKRLLEFGSYLIEIRHKAGFRSQDSALAAARKKFKSTKVLSKSMLSLFERGEVMTVKPEVLRLLSRLYNVDYKEMAERWFEERYGISGFYSSRKEQFVKQADQSLAKLSLRDSDQDLTIISLEYFEKLQSKLPKGTEVGVVSSIFLDNTVLFDMVAKNISRGVIYRYLMPEHSKVTYQMFVKRIEEKYPKLNGKIDGNLSTFMARPNLDFPMNYVVYLYPNRKIEGFVGLLHQNKPRYFQIAGPRLSLQLCNSFKWEMTLARDLRTKKAINSLELSIQGEYISEEHKSLDLYKKVQN